MLGRLLNFLKYNNAVPLTIGLLFLGATGALAATPEVRGAVVSSQQQVVSVDNSYIVNVDLSSYTPSVQITGVTEDADNYYIAYTFTTIDLADYRWQNVTENKTLTVSKQLLDGKDLGLYATQQLAEVSLQDLDRLRKTQDIEKKTGVTPAVVATTYSGLVGKFLDPKEETLPGYSPVIPEPPKPVADASSQQTAAAVTAGATQTPNTSSSNTSGDTTPPTISILGNNPATVDLHSSYVDLGAIITDNVNLNLGYTVSVDGKPAAASETISIDTSVAGTHTIEYIARDQAGNSSTATRTVVVSDPNAPASTATTTPAAADTSPSTPTTADTPSITTATTATTTSTAPASTTSTATTTPPDTADTTAPAATSTPPAPAAGTSDTSSAATTTATSTTP